MNDDALDFGTALRRWLDRQEDGALDAFLELSPTSWQAAVRAFPYEVSLETVRKLIDHSYSLLGVAPLEALTLADLARQMVTRCALPMTTAGDVAVETEGDAWRGYAQALLEVGRYPEAEQAAETAGVIYALIGSRLHHKMDILGLLRGQIIYALGRTADGFLLIEQATNALLGLHNDKKRYVKGRMLYACLLASERRPREALAIFEDTIAVADELHDREMKAAILNNVGICYKQLGDLEKAKQCIQLGLEMLLELKLPADALRARTALVEILVIQGKYDRAIFELYAGQNEFIRLGLPVDAALNGLWIANILPLAGRSDEVASLCHQMIETFSKAGLHAKAIQALAYLRDTAKGGGVTNFDVESARAVLESLRIFQGLTDSRHSGG